MDCIPKDLLIAPGLEGAHEDEDEDECCLDADEPFFMRCVLFDDGDARHLDGLDLLVG